MEYDKSKAKEADTPYSSSMLARAKLLGNQSMIECQCIQRVGDEVEDEIEDSYKIAELPESELDLDIPVTGGERGKDIFMHWICWTWTLLNDMKSWLESKESADTDVLVLSEEERERLSGFREEIDGILWDQLLNEIINYSADEDSIAAYINSIRNQLFDLARSLIQYQERSTLEYRNLCYTLIYQILLGLSNLDSIGENEELGFKKEFIMSDEDMMRVDKEQDLREVQTAIYLIERMEIYEDSLERSKIPFNAELIKIMDETSVQARCHMIPYEYLKVGIFTPLIDAISGLLRYMARHEEEQPEYSSPVDVNKSLLSVLHAAFPMNAVWVSENERLTDLSQQLFFDASERIVFLHDKYVDLWNYAQTRSIMEIPYEDIRLFLDLATKILEIVNSSPQNLRVGNAATNKSIGAALDIPLQDVSTTVLEKGDYADDLSDLSNIAGQFDAEKVHFVNPGSLTNLALIALLAGMDMGDQEIKAYSGTIEGMSAPTMQSSDRSGMKSPQMEEDFIPLVVPMSYVEECEYLFDDCLSLDMLPPFFRFTTSSETKKGVKKPPRRPVVGEAIKSRAFSALTKAEIMRIYLERLSNDRIGEQLELLGYKTISTSGEGNNCFFHSIYNNLIRELAAQKNVAPASRFSVNTLISEVRERIGNPTGLIDLSDEKHRSETDSAEETNPPPITPGRQVLNAIVAFLGGGFQINLEVTEPYNVDRFTGQIMFFRHNILSDAVPGGEVINLRVFFNGFNHFQKIETISQE